ncbi:hypothetical protein [Streptomyces cylindrosporus]|uniref:Uncharacterized protein n=1 Tax=Streptomyces cylindrosporus TaxID=2927583 RepID=A0ABS9YKX2_9ACTN|nr:hypothetical protein [Streptomyces cylindrosporus]MCI3277892.1 hypothetical protein [Streptomyces cylindrosporus]
MKGQHSPSSGARRAGDRTTEQETGQRRVLRPVLRIALALAGLAAIALTFVLVRDLIGFDHAVRNPEDGFSDWQCASQSGTCDP